MMAGEADLQHLTRLIRSRALGAFTLALFLASAACGESEDVAGTDGSAVIADGGDTPPVGAVDSRPPDVDMDDARIGQGEVGGDGRSDAKLLYSSEGLACSNNPADVPLLVCETGLSCAAAYRPRRPDGTRGDPAYLCRVPCTPQGTCSEGICCPAAAAGQTVYVCTPRAFCDGAD
jgi:hypothetical protein